MAGGVRITEFLYSLMLLACSVPQVELDFLQKTFARAEYIATGDGWAEARRRRLLERYLQRSGFAVSAVQQRFHDGRRETKYRQVVLHAERSPRSNLGKKRTVTLALLPPERGAEAVDFALRQRECDQVLFSILAKLSEFHSLDFVSSPSCLGLTAQTNTRK